MKEIIIHTAKFITDKAYLTKGLHWFLRGKKKLAYICIFVSVCMCFNHLEGIFLPWFYSSVRHFSLRNWDLCYQWSFSTLLLLKWIHNIHLSNWLVVNTIVQNLRITSLLTRKLTTKTKSSVQVKWYAS